MPNETIPHSDLPESDTSPEPPEIVLDHAVLYHGSTVPGIQVFNPAEEDTVGAGLYLTDERAAVGYAQHRSKERANAPPIVYAVEVPHARIANLRNRDTFDRVMARFEPVLNQERMRARAEHAPWNRVAVLDRAVETIRNGNILSPKEVVESIGGTFTRYLQRQGYDGLKALKGGEGSIGPHESYVIFDPKILEVRSEQPVRSVQAA